MLIVVLLVAAAALVVLGVVIEATVYTLIGLALAVLAGGLLAYVMRSGSDGIGAGRTDDAGRQPAEKARPVEKARPAEKAKSAVTATAGATGAETHESAEDRATEDAEVYVVAGRRRFHRSGCSMLDGQSPDELTLVEARGEGFTACSICVAVAEPRS